MTGVQTCALPISGGGAPRVLLGAHFATVYNQDAYYRADEGDLTRKRALLRQVMTLAGVTPAVRAQGLREEAWARISRDKKQLFVFVVSGHDAGQTRVELLDGPRLGLDPAKRYVVKDVLRGTVLAPRTGQDLLTRGLDTTLPKEGTAVLVIEPAP